MGLCRYICMNFEDLNKWREELQDMVCDEVESPSSAKQPAVHVQDNDSEDEDEEEPEFGRSEIRTYNEAF